MKEDDPLHMVDISDKTPSAREAEAVGTIVLRPETVSAVRDGTIKKGDVLTVAEVAAIQAAKHTPDIVPLCHQVPLTSVQVSFSLEVDGVVVRCTVRAHYSTGVEMEALTAVSVALLTIWDMVKYLEKDSSGQYPTARITDVRVVRKEK